MSIDIIFKKCNLCFFTELKNSQLRLDKTIYLLTTLFIIIIIIIVMYLPNDNVRFMICVPTLVVEVE